MTELASALFAMRLRTAVFLTAVSCIGTPLLGQKQLPAHAVLLSLSPDTRESDSLLERVIANQKKDDLAQFIYERMERLEIRKNPASTQPTEVRISRAIPAGTGIDRIPVRPDGKPVDEVAYRTELEKLERALSWAAQDGRAQREAYEKIAKKQKERADFIDASRQAFVYTFIDREALGGHMVAKYHMVPNPAYKATSRSTAIFAKVRGDLWIDEDAGQLARLEVEVTDDISIAGFLAKIYKGSHFAQEREEMAPGVWLPSYAQYDFDGRKFFMSFAIHERTSYSQYRRIGPPREALQAIRSELGKPIAANITP
jgi:hypothetical protein